jgi:hypothetical protein
MLISDSEIPSMKPATSLDIQEILPIKKKKNWKCKKKYIQKECRRVDY